MTEKSSSGAINAATTKIIASNGNGTAIHDTSNTVDLQHLSDKLVEMYSASVVKVDQTAAHSNGNDDVAAYLRTAGTDDEANAQCLVRLWPKRYAWNDAFGWMVYKEDPVLVGGYRWHIKGAGADLDRHIVDMLRQRVKECNDQPYEAVRKYCKQNAGRVEGCKRLLSSLVEVEESKYDASPDLLNCLNGVVDLRTGVLRPGQPDDRLTHLVAAPYSPIADQSIWVDWLRSVVDADTADYLQLAVGYSLTGHTSEEVLFYLFGPPRSGKGVLLETLLALLGRPIAQEVTFSTFTAQRTPDTQNFDLAPLKPCRFIAASESNAHERFNEAKVKSITGGSEVWCAFKHRDLFGYRPQYKIWLSSNQEVNADPDDDAVWSRIRVIGFPNSYLGNEDKQLKIRLRRPEALAGLLAWAVAGAVRWYSMLPAGLPELPSSAATKAAHRELVDNVGAWLAENTTNTGDFSPNVTLYSDYSSWCADNGVSPKQQKAFTVALERKGYVRDRIKINRSVVRGFVGVEVSVKRPFK